MLSITLYNFAKRKNSTKQPANTDTHTDLTGYMKTPSSIIDPVITVKASPIGYNYAYVSDFSRYYFINDIVYSMGEWSIYLSSDPLASFKTTLGGLTAYVIRSASSYSGMIKDTMYPLTGDISSSVQDWDPFSGTGYFYVSVVGNSSNSVVTYQMSATIFREFMQKVLGYANDGSLWGTVEESIKNSIFNPIDYIANCYWIPRSGGSIVTTTNINVGNYSITLSDNVYVYTSNTPQSFISSFTVGNHPQASTRGRFCNLSPYSEYILSAAGFGNIELPADLFTLSSNTVVMRVAFDIRTGSATLVVLVNGVRVARVSSSLGVSIPLTQINRDILGGIVQIAMGGGKAVAAASAGNMLKAVGGLSEYINGLSSVVGTTSTTGALGSSTNLYDEFHLTTVYHTIADGNNTDNGKPYCQYVQINTLSGYMECQKGVFQSADATASEISEVNSHMVSGFYYE